MAADLQFCDSLAYSVAKFSCYGKGKEYFKDGLVEKIWKEGDEYKAIVSGTKTYTVSMRFEDEELIHSCTCPYELGGACKHTVAAILAFSKDKKFASAEPVKPQAGSKQNPEKLLSQITNSQLRLFTRKLLVKNPDLVNDLKIFLQGQKQTPVTVEQYKTRFRNQLDELNLPALIQAWYEQGEDYDYYDNGGYDIDSGGEAITDIVDRAIEEAEKYGENNNQGEELKIYQALLEALGEKKQTLKGDEKELEDWFLEEMARVLAKYVETVKKTDNINLKQIGITYLCKILEDLSWEIEPADVSAGLKRIAVSAAEVKIALSALAKTAAKKTLTVPESSLLAHLYFVNEDLERFEEISVANLEVNPNLTLDLLKYYQSRNQKIKILETAKLVLKRIAGKKDDIDIVFYNELSINYLEIETRIRRFLETILTSKEDYAERIANLEQLFLKTASLADYKTLASRYAKLEEKHRFWEMMKDHFTDSYNVKTVFRVFRFENQKQEILWLIEKYPEADCFPEMVAFTRDEYANACFVVYRKKIEKILEKVDIEKYKEAAYHLRQMKLIGKTEEFNEFLDWIRNTYWRRKRLIEELDGANL